VHQLASLSLKNRALIALVTVVTAVFGVVSFTSLKQELIPNLEIPALAVVTIHPGASAEVVAQDVTGPVEQAMLQVPGLQGTTGTSATGMSMVLAEFEFGADMATAEQKMNQAISRVAGFLPEAVDPTVVAISLDEFPVVQVAVSGGAPRTLAADLERRVVPELERLEGVASASILGGPGQRVAVTPDPMRMAAAGVDHMTLATVLTQNGVLTSAGMLDDGSQALTVQVGERLSSAEEIAALPLVTAAGPVRLGDVADVELTTDAADSYSLLDGEQAVSLSITKLPDANTVEVSHAVQDALPELQARMAGVTFHTVLDQATFIEDSIAALTQEGLLGLLFAVLVILFFLRSWRATLVTAVSIPMSIMVAFVAMNATGYTLNLLTLGALTIAIGRIVDDSIVVIENVERHLSYGKSRRRTIIDAVREVAGAITASTITTVVVFLPIALVGGMAGVLFQPFAFTVAIAMGASLLVALTIVPVLAYWFLRRKQARATAPDDADATPTGTLASQRAEAGDVGPAGHGVEDAHHADTGALQRGYRRVIDWVIGHRWTTLAAATAVLVGTIAMVPLLKTNFLGDMGQNSLGVSQQVAPGTSVSAQLELATSIDEALRGVDGVQTVQATIGSNPVAALGGGGDSIAWTLTTDPGADQDAITTAVRHTFERFVEPGQVSVSAAAGMGFSNDVEIAVSGADLDQVGAAAPDIAAAMADLPEAEQVTTSLSEARPTVQVSVDREAAAGAGLTETQVSQTVAGMLAPRMIGQVTIDSSAIDVYLTPTDPPTTVAEVEALVVPTAQGLVPLTALATVEVVDGPVSLTTADGVRPVTVTITPGSDDIGQAGTAVAAALDAVELPDGIQAELGGITAEQNEAFSQLGLAMLLAILIVYVVMVATFRSLLHPFLLLVSIPFAATGAILLQLATGIPLGVPSLIGVLMLIGIVVTNAIVLIDLVKQYRDQGMTMTDALVLGSVRRVRPIVMTALATILALTPMAIGITGHGGFISQPLALVVIGGLFSSTAMTLLVLPALYHLVESVGRRAVRVTED